MGQVGVRVLHNPADHVGPRKLGHLGLPPQSIHSGLARVHESSPRHSPKVGKHRTLGGFRRLAHGAMVISGIAARTPLRTEGIIMNRSGARLTQTFLAVTVLSLGVTACTQATSPPSKVGVPTTTTSPTAAPPAASPAALSTPKTVSAPTNAGASTPGSGISSTACPAEHTWGTGPEIGSAAMSQAPLYLTRVGQHACYDRVVFDINGPQAVGFAARYVPVVLADASGKPVRVAGRAALQVVVRAPIFGTDSQGHQPGVSSPN